MNRAERRRLQKEDKKNELNEEKKFVLSQSDVVAIQRQAAEDAIKLLSKRTFIMMMALPLEVLITEDYWMKSAKKKIPKFMDDLLRVYKGYESGQLTMEEMKSDLWEFAGIKCESDDKE